VYLENLYDKKTFSIISDYCQKIKDSDMVTDPKKVHGRGMYVFNKAGIMRIEKLK
jgi:hypothetical protein